MFIYSVQERKDGTLTLTHRFEMKPLENTILKSVTRRLKTKALTGKGGGCVCDTRTAVSKHPVTSAQEPENWSKRRESETNPHVTDRERLSGTAL